MQEHKVQQEILLIKKRYGIASAEELQQIEQQLQVDPEVRRLWAHLEQVELPQDIIEQVRQPAGTAGVEMIKATIHQRRKARLRRTKNWSIAAGIVLLAGVGTWSWSTWKQTEKSLPVNTAQQSDQIQLHLPDGKTISLTTGAHQTLQTNTALLQLNGTEMIVESGSTSAATEWNTLVVPPKLDYSITLPDGSKVRLNAATQLKFPGRFSSTSREVFIDGEAYFDIKKDADRPFVVHTSGTDIQVLGTGFNVNTYQQGIIRVALVEGNVQLTNKNEILPLTPGKEAILKTGLGFTIQGFNSKVTLSWMNGVFQFNNTPLSEIAAMIPRWYDEQIKIDNAEIAGMTFTGNLDKSKPLKIFMENLENTVGLRCYYKDEVLHIGR